MFKMPIPHSAFQYECKLIEPVVDIPQINEYEVDIPKQSIKKNRRKPGEKLLKQINKQMIKKSEDMKKNYEQSIDNVLNTIMTGYEDEY